MERFSGSLAKIVEMMAQLPHVFINIYILKAITSYIAPAWYWSINLFSFFFTLQHEYWKNFVLNKLLNFPEPIICVETLLWYSGDNYYTWGCMMALLQVKATIWMYLLKLYVLVYSANILMVVVILSGSSSPSSTNGSVTSFKLVEWILSAGST